MSNIERYWVSQFKAMEEERDALAAELREMRTQWLGRGEQINRLAKERDMYKFNWELERGEIGMIPEDGMISLRSKRDEHNPFENAYIDEKGWIHDRKKWIEDNCDEVV